MARNWSQAKSSEPGGGEARIIDDVVIDAAEPSKLGRTSLKRSSLRGARPVRDDDGMWMRGRRPGSTQDLGGDPTAMLEADREVPLRDASEFRWTGRRGRVRPEVLVVLAGAAFVILGLLKPWPNPTKSNGSESPVAVVAAASGSSAASTSAASAKPGATPTLDVYALIPPYDYRDGQWPPPTSGTTQAEVPVQPALTAWSSFDWSFLTNLDKHSRWGISALTLPSSAPSAKPQPAPYVSWEAEIAPWSPSNVIIPRGSSAFALALTWPADLTVNSVTFDYLGTVGSRPTVDMPVVAPAAGVSPLPATAVATPPVTSSPTPVPFGEAASGALRSGTFWIPPSSDLASPTPGAVRTAWGSSPWSWPVGLYRATLATNAGTMIVALQLQSA